MCRWLTCGDVASATERTRTPNLLIRSAGPRVLTRRDEHNEDIRFQPRGCRLERQMARGSDTRNGTTPGPRPAPTCGRLSRERWSPVHHRHTRPDRRIGLRDEPDRLASTGTACQLLHVVAPPLASTTKERITSTNANASVDGLSCNPRRSTSVTQPGPWPGTSGANRSSSPTGTTTRPNTPSAANSRSQASEASPCGTAALPDRLALSQPDSALMTARRPSASRTDNVSPVRESSWRTSSSRRRRRALTPSPAPRVSRHRREGASTGCWT